MTTPPTASACSAKDCGDAATVRLRRVRNELTGNVISWPGERDYCHSCFCDIITLAEGDYEFRPLAPDPDGNAWPWRPCEDLPRLKAAIDGRQA